MTKCSKAQENINSYNGSMLRGENGKFESTNNAIATRKKKQKQEIRLRHKPIDNMLNTVDHLTFATEVKANQHQPCDQQKHKQQQMNREEKVIIFCRKLLRCFFSTPTSTSSSSLPVFM